MLKVRGLGCAEDDDGRLQWAVVRDGSSEPLFTGRFDDVWNQRRLLTAREIRQCLEAGGHVVEEAGSYSAEWYLGKDGPFIAEKMRDAHYLAEHITSRHLGFGFPIRCEAGPPPSLAADLQQHANATAAVMRAIGDGYEQIQTYGGWVDLYAWAFAERDPSSPFRLGRWIAEYDSSRPALLGHYGRILICDNREGQTVWPLRKETVECE